jgi:hypothetical protein
MQLLNYNPTSYAGKGEAFFYGEKKSALSIFRSPNTDDLKGIALHTHPNCDDIDIVIKGDIYFSNDGKSFTRAGAPALIANLAGTPHAIYVPNKSEALMYGLRSPFLGGESVDHNKVGKKSKIYNLQDLASGVHNIFESERTIAKYYIDQTEINELNKKQDRLLINLNKESAVINDQELFAGSVLKNWDTQLNIQTNSTRLLYLETKEIK